MKKYNIIYADPPWRYKGRGGKKCVEHKYPTEGLEYLKALPIASIAADNCILFMWVTFPKLEECFEAIKAWGFTYKTLGFNWVKRNKNSQPDMLNESKWFWGMGRWTRSNPEICLIATKGNPVRLSASVHSVVDSPLQAHSQKPAIVRDRIVQLCGDLPRIELFSRQAVEGWDSWGNEIENSIELQPKESK